MFGLGWPEVAVVAVIALFIFGPKKIPEIGSSLGQTLRGFKDELNNPENSDPQDDDPPSDSENNDLQK